MRTLSSNSYYLEQLNLNVWVVIRGIAGGVVSQKYFRQNFGMYNDDGTPNEKKILDVSSIVVSVLQAGAFFGALGSAPVSGTLLLLASLNVYNNNDLR